MAGRVTQEVVEATVLPTSESLRVTQEVVEAVVFATSESLRVTQEVVEAVVFATSELLRVTQLVVEVLIANPVYQGSTGPAGQGTHQGKGPRGYRGKRHGGFGLDTHRTVQIVV